MMDQKQIEHFQTNGFVNVSGLFSDEETQRYIDHYMEMRERKKPMIEGFTGDLRVFEDKTRRFEVHLIKGLPHADGLVIGYLPKERILVYADMFNLPPASDPVPNPPVVGTGVFVANIERLKLNPERIMSVHSLNPDRLTSLAEIRASMGLK